MKILIVKSSALGDIIHAFPAVQYLRKRFPQAQIDWVVEASFAELVQAHPDVNNVIPFNSKKWRQNLFKLDTWRDIRKFLKTLTSTTYDYLFDLQGNFKSGLINFFVKGGSKVGFGLATVKERINVLFTNKRYNPPIHFNIREDYLFIAQSPFKDTERKVEGIQLKINEEGEKRIKRILEDPNVSHGKKIMVCAGSNWPNKQLSLPTLKSFLEKIAKNQEVSFLFAWGTSEEKKGAEELALAFPGHCIVMDRLPLPLLQNLMSRIDLVIAMDSLPLHMAGTAGTPTYSVFGASLAAKFKPMGQRHRAFQGACPYGRTFVKRCSVLRTCKTGACVKDIQAEDLYNDFKKFA